MLKIATRSKLKMAAAAIFNLVFCHNLGDRSTFFCTKFIDRKSVSKGDPLVRNEVF